jgi:hypothetical protein
MKDSGKGLIHTITPLLFLLSAYEKRGNAFIYNVLLPLLCNSREGGRGDEYVCTN